MFCYVSGNVSHFMVFRKKESKAIYIMMHTTQIIIFQDNLYILHGIPIRYHWITTKQDYASHFHTSLDLNTEMPG